MNRIPFRTIPIVAALGALPAIASAQPADLALTACARQVVNDLAAHQSVAPRYSVVLKGDPAPSPYDLRPYRFALEARDPKTGVLVVRAECDAQGDGKVIAYRTLPLGKAPATFAEYD